MATSLCFCRDTNQGRIHGRLCRFHPRADQRSGRAEDLFEKAPASLKGRPAAARAFYGRHEVLEGPALEGVVILEFPTFEEAKDWYDSPLYREAREHRFKGADYRAVIVQGL